MKNEVNRAPMGKKKLVFILSALAILQSNSLFAQQVDSTTVSQSKIVFAYDTFPNDPLHARIYHLDNGLTVYLSRNTIKPEIQTYVVIRAGGQNDPLESTGLAHYQEHIMFKGTSQYGTTDYAKEKPYLDAIDSLYEVYGQTTDEAARKAIYREIDSVSYLSSKIAIANEFDKLMSIIGATEVNAYTSTNRTCYHEVIPSDELTRWAMIESGRFQDLVVRGFHTELETVYEEFNMYSTMDYDKIDQAINNILYASIPYRQHSVIGTQEHLKNPSLKNIKNFYHTFYRPNNAAICLSGDLDYDHAIEVINTYFGSWQPIDSLQAALDNDALLFQRKAGLGTHKDTIIYGNEAPQLWMAWNVPDIHSEEIPVLDMLTKVLFNGYCGLIDLNINKKQKMLWGVASSDQANDVSTFYLIGQPKTGQSLDNLRKQFLNQIKKLQAGEFSEDLLQAIVNNIRREEIEMSDNNNYRAGYVFVNAFVYDLPYEQVIHYSDALSKVTKEQIVAFANKYLGDNYACVMKQQKPDLAPVTIDKPTITPIEMNRDKSSLFASQLADIEPDRLQPEYLDFDKDIQQTTLRKGQKLIYRHNNNNELFYLLFLADKGTDTDPVIDVATDLIDYLGTATYSSEAYETALYSQAAQVDIYNDKTKTTFRASSLQSNFDTTLILLEDRVFHSVPNNGILKQVIADRARQHNDNKSEQSACFEQLLSAGFYGLETAQAQITAVAPKTLAKQDAASILQHLSATVPLTGTILYYGPAPMQEVAEKLNDNSQIVNAYQRTEQQTTPPEHIKTQRIKQSEVWVAPYKANAIYMVQYANPGVTYSPKQEAIIALFNEYFSGSMGSIVFQEMRESRALCYASYAGYVTPNFAGDDNYFMTYIISQNDKLKDCVLAFDSICTQMPLSQAAFDQAKASLLKQMENKRYTGFEAISAYLRYTYKGWDHDWNKDIYNEVQRLTLKDVKQFQTQVLTNLPYRYLILGDKKQLNRKFLKTLGPVKYLKLKDIFVY